MTAKEDIAGNAPGLSQRMPPANLRHSPPLSGRMSSRESPLGTETSEVGPQLQERQRFGQKRQQELEASAVGGRRCSSDPTPGSRRHWSLRRAPERLLMSILHGSPRQPRK